MMEEEQGRRKNGKARAGRRPRRLKFLFSSIVLLVIFLALELTARLFFPAPAPRQHPSGIWINPLPLVNHTYATSNVPAALSVDAKELEPEKRPGERRVFVFGESSVEGLPWGADGSAAAMLRRRFVDEGLGDEYTVVNMGRSASVTLDTFYYLLAIDRFEPDYIVFFQGTNDRVVSTGGLDRCAPVTHESLHAAWRWALSRSVLLWNLRVRVPHVLGLSSSPEDVANDSSVSGDGCDPAVAFERWTDILVDQARSTGAEVIVTLPMASIYQDADDYGKIDCPPREGEPWNRRLERLDPKTRILLWSRLEPSCDFENRLKNFVVERRAGSHDPMMPQGLAEVRAAWSASAKRHGAVVVDPVPAVRSVAKEGILGPPWILDRVHPSLDANWHLSALWYGAIREIEDEPAPVSEELRASWPKHFAHASEGIERFAEECLSKGDVLVAISLFEHSADFFDSESAKQRLHDIRQALADVMAPGACSPSP